MKKDVKEIERCIQTLLEVQRRYPLLKNTLVRLNLSKLQSSARARWTIFNGYTLIIDSTKTKKFTKGILRGLFAHELGHIEQTYESNILKRMYDSFILFLLDYFPIIMSEKNIRSAERDADIRALKHGFGKNLIIFKRNIEKGRSKEEIQSMQYYYLSIKEVENYLKRIKKTKK